MQRKQKAGLIAVLSIFLLLGISWYWGAFAYLSKIPPEEKIDTFLEGKEGKVVVNVWLAVPINPILNYKLEENGLDIIKSSESNIIGYIHTDNLEKLASVPEVIWIMGGRPLVPYYGISVPATQARTKDPISLKDNTEDTDVYRKEKFHLISTYTGNGKTIGVIDDGVNCTALTSWGQRTGKWSGSCIELNPNAFPEPHGTSVAHILATLAPNVDILSYDVCDDQDGNPGCDCWDTNNDGIPDTCAQPWPHEGIDTINDNNVDIISMSMSVGLLDAVDTYTSIRNAIDNGIVGVIAAGNSGCPYIPKNQFGIPTGPCTSTKRKSKTISVPGVLKEAVTVGAIDRDFQVMAFSGQGPVTARLEDGTMGTYYKPDITAMGQLIKTDTDVGGHSCNNDMCERSSPGTSAATPQVSALAALIREANPILSPADVKKIIQETAKELPEEGFNCFGDVNEDFSCICQDNDYGMGVIQVNRAVQSATSPQGFLLSVKNMFGGY